MNSVSFFASPVLSTLSHNIIAALLYDLGMEDATGIDRKAVETIFFASVTQAADGILKSERTKQRILESLQDKTLEPEIAKLRVQGIPLREDYFPEQFSRVISRANARKIAPEFLELFREKLAANEALLRQIIWNYRTPIQQGQWQINGNGQQELAELMEALRGQQVRQELEYIHANGSGSGQLEHWDHDIYVLPVRGLRQMEIDLTSDSLMYITGAPGCGKSLLVSAYLHNLLFNKFMEGKDIYYYRFVRGISGRRTFAENLGQFLASKSGASLESVTGDLPKALAQSQYFFVIDDLHQAEDLEILELIHRIWIEVEKLPGFGGKLIVIDRQKPANIPLSDKYHYHYRGLSGAERSALVRDKWQLQMPPPLARQLSKKFVGNPQLLLLLRGWWIIEHHTDTELERFINEMPLADAGGKNLDRLRDYVAQHCYDAFERNDSRLNSFLKAASVFRLPEQEYFFDQVYEKIGGGDFQVLLEKLVDEYGLMKYDESLNRYRLPDLFGEFFYNAISGIQMRRILHHSAAQLYRRRFEQTGEITDAIEGARHFRIAEREEEAVRLIEPVLGEAGNREQHLRQLLGILEKVNLDLFDNDQAKLAALYHRGKFYLQNGLFKEAEADFSACQLLEGSETLRGEIAYSMGLIARAGGRVDEAYPLFEQALEIYEQSGNRPGMGEVYARLGELHLIRDEYDRAFEAVEKSLEIGLEIGNREGALHAYNTLGWISKEKADWDAAERFYRKSLELSEELHGLGGAAQALNNLAQIREVRGEWEQALEFYHKEIRLNEKLNDWMGMAKAYQRIGDIYRRLESPEQAISFYQQSQALFEKTEDLNGLASLYHGIAQIYHGREEWESAMGYYQKSQEIYEKINNLDAYGESFAQMAAVYKAMKEWERALDLYDKSLEIKEKLGDSPGVAEIYRKIGDIYFERGELEYAVEVYERSLKTREAQGDNAGIAELFFALGNVFKADRQWKKSLDYYQKSLQLFERLNDEPGMARANIARGNIYHELKDWTHALEFYQKALVIYNKLHNAKGLAGIHYSIGNMYHDSAKWDLALEHYRKSLPMFEKAADLFGMAQALGNISSLEFERKEHISAIGKQVEILLFFQDQNRREMVDRVLANLVSCHQELGADTFQALLNNCLDKIAKEGVIWGAIKLIPPDKAGKMIKRLFFAS